MDKFQLRSDPKSNVFERHKLPLSLVLPFDLHSQHSAKPPVNVIHGKNFVHIKRIALQKFTQKLSRVVNTQVRGNQAKQSLQMRSLRESNVQSEYGREIGSTQASSALIQRETKTYESQVVKSERSRIFSNNKKPQNLAQVEKLNLIKNKCLSNIKRNQLKETQSKESLNSVDHSVDQPTQQHIVPLDAILLQKSPYEGRPATLFFDYPKCCEQERDKRQVQSAKQKFSLRYKISGSEYRCIVNNLVLNGFKEDQDQWNIYFDITGTKTKTIQTMNKYQKINHFPGCWYLGRKDFLYKVIIKGKRRFPSEFNFIPLTYLFPVDLERFEGMRQTADKDKLWIMKPVNQACGRGIKLITKESKIKRKKDVLVSQYIKNPHLINNFKYDLRLYVLVTSFDPLKVFLFEEGLVRFATYQYSTKVKEAGKRYIHLTNYSVNKTSKRFVKNQHEQDGKGSKWSHTYFKRWLQENGYSSQTIFSSIKDVLIKTCIAAQPNMLDLTSKTMERRNCCFQLYGFDILLDSSMKPWLMEVNVCPSLASSAPMDKRIKHLLLSDCMHILGLQPYVKKDYEQEKKKQRDIKISSSQKRQIFSKNLKDLQNLNFDNCIEKLQPDDWNVLFQLQEEAVRAGHFQRIFPLRQNVSKYLPLFQFQRYNNILLSKHILSEQNFLNKIAQRKY